MLHSDVKVSCVRDFPLEDLMHNAINADSDNIWNVTNTVVVQYVGDTMKIKRCQRTGNRINDLRPNSLSFACYHCYTRAEN